MERTLLGLCTVIPSQTSFSSCFILNNLKLEILEITFVVHAKKMAKERSEEGQQPGSK